ncbi:MAG: hypothetical protein ACKOJF_33285, partial [Planctomycetaceae bacterium]
MPGGQGSNSHASGTACGALISAARGWRGETPGTAASPSSFFLTFFFAEIFMTRVLGIPIGLVPSRQVS